MSTEALNRRFLETTRGQIVVLLRRGARTVDELASAVGLTDNAVRNHLATLERDGIVRQSGVRRGMGVGKPALVYEVHPDAEPLFSRAYAPVLATLVETLVATQPPEQAATLLREVGRRLAQGAGGRAAGAMEQRVQAAADLLIALGGDVVVEAPADAPRIRGSGCPLSAAVSREPKLCHAVEALVSEVAGVPMRSCCEHGDRPRCCFAVDEAEPAA